MSVDLYASRSEGAALTHRILALSADARLEHPRALATRALSRPLVVFVGAMAKGPDNFANGVAEHQISLSEFPLSASAVLAKVRSSFTCELLQSQSRTTEVFSTSLLSAPLHARRAGISTGIANGGL